MPVVTSYIVKRGRKYLHIDNKTGVSWGGESGAFHFFSTEAATQVACALTTAKANILIVPCEGE